MYNSFPPRNLLSPCMHTVQAQVENIIFFPLSRGKKKGQKKPVKTQKKDY